MKNEKPRARRTVNKCMIYLFSGCVPDVAFEVDRLPAMGANEVALLGASFLSSAKSARSPGARFGDEPPHLERFRPPRLQGFSNDGGHLNVVTVQAAGA